MKFFELLREFVPNTLGAWVFVGLTLWVLTSFFYRVFVVSQKRSIPLEIKNAFAFPEFQNRTLASVMALEMEIISKQKKDEDSLVWTLLEVTRAYWLFKLKGLTIQIIAFMLLFIPAMILIFSQAQVKEDKGSLEAVVNTFSSFGLAFLAILIVISGFQALFSLHEMPLPSFKKMKKATITLFVW